MVRQGLGEWPTDTNIFTRRSLNPTAARIFPARGHTVSYLPTANLAAHVAARFSPRRVGVCGRNTRLSLGEEFVLQTVIVELIGRAWETFWSEKQPTTRKVLDRDRASPRSAPAESFSDTHAAQQALHLRGARGGPPRGERWKCLVRPEPR